MDARSRCRHAQAMLRLTIRIDHNGKAWFGPGKAKLLEAVEKTGSIRKAAASLAMSYRRAWLLLQALEKTVQGPVTVTTTGGRKGGGTKLTPLGRALLRRYRGIERVSGMAAHIELKKIEELMRVSAKVRRRK